MKPSNSKKTGKVIITAQMRRAAQIVAEHALEAKPMSVKQAMITSGYSENTANQSTKITKSPGWQWLMNHYLPESKLIKTHAELLNAHFVDHMVFPLDVTDAEITEILAEVGCRTRRFMHSETQTHVWFWSPDNKARKDALEMGYKLRGKLKANDDPGDRIPTINILNFGSNPSPVVVPLANYAKGAKTNEGGGTPEDVSRQASGTVPQTKP